MTVLPLQWQSLYMERLSLYWDRVLTEISKKNVKDFSRKISLKILFLKWQTCCPGHNELNQSIHVGSYHNLSI